MKRILFSTFLALLSALGLIAVMQPSQAASATQARPAAAASCVTHYKSASGLSWSSGQFIYYYSDAGQYWSIWDWNDCTGGVYFKIVFSTDCKLHYYQSNVAAGGVITSTFQTGIRGATCNARPGTLQFYRDGRVRTVSGANTVLSDTGTHNASPFEWLFEFVIPSSGTTPWLQEQLNQGGFTYWIGPRDYWQ